MKKRILLDENLPRPLIEDLAEHEVTTVQELGWSGIQNGDLIQKIEGKFDVFLTSDKNLRYQQNLIERKIAILQLPTNRLPLLKKLIPQIQNAISQATQNNDLEISL